MSSKQTPSELWEIVQADLLKHYGQNTYDSWFSKIHYKDFDGKSVFLAVPTNFVRDWISANYSDLINQLWRHYNPQIRQVEIVTDTSLAAPIKPAHSKASNAENNADNQDDDSVFVSLLDPRFTFDNFVIGKPNELAYAAARAVAESDGVVSESNPLFLYGGVGLGKTHLMHAIAWHVKKNTPKRRVIYMSAEKFMYQFVSALRNKDIMSFKEKFRSVDVLMIDDIQFICGKESTQEEFFHTFNALIDNNKQMVISCDRSPSDLDDIEDRIKSRLGWGLVADLHSTNYELRLGILQSKIDQMDVLVPTDVIEFIAAKITSNVRELEGALNKVIAHSTLVGKDITLDTTRDILKDLLRTNSRVITIEQIQKKVAERYNIRISDLSSSNRQRSIARPRQIAMYLSKTLTTKSLMEIGKKFGKKDHTTVMHAIKKIEQLCATDASIDEEVRLLIKILQN